MKNVGIIVLRGRSRNCEIIYFVRQTDITPTLRSFLDKRRQSRKLVDNSSDLQRVLLWLLNKTQEGQMLRDGEEKKILQWKLSVRSEQHDRALLYLANERNACLIGRSVQVSRRATPNSGDSANHRGIVGR